MTGSGTSELNGWGEGGGEGKIVVRMMISEGVGRCGKGEGEGVRGGEGSEEGGWVWEWEWVWRMGEGVLSDLERGREGWC